ncbi:hypothetical protein AB0J90_03670 [Micromonospora sp. NPDC049523]|uniref:hypothetical protein n=1 Tax=Micromonospora sp. NPDC049523 TaxID=3155921 RepID=UPI003421EFDF
MSRFGTMLALLRPTAYAMRWVPLLAACGFGLAVVGVPSATAVVLSAEDLSTLLRVGAMAGALGAAFVLDDPAERSIAVVPTQRPARHLLRVLIALPVLAAWWVGMLAVTVAGAGPGIGPVVPLADLTVEATAIVALVVALAAMARRRSESGIVSTVAAPALLVGLVVLYLVPERIALFVVPDDPRWAAAHDRWSVLAILALAGFLRAGIEPIRRPPWSRPGAARRLTG